MTVQCKNLRELFARHVKNAQRPGEAYAYSISFSFLDDFKYEQIKAIKELKERQDKKDITFDDFKSNEYKIKELENSLPIIDRFMKWEKEHYDNVD